MSHSDKQMNESEEEVPQANTVRVICQLKNENGDEAGAPFDLPISISKKQLGNLCNAVLEKEEVVPYAFFVGGEEILSTLEAVLTKQGKESGEHVTEIVYQPQAVFKVRAVTRCSSTIEGHAEAVISVSFSPDGRYLASGSGDTTVRFWDVNTETPQHTCKGHTHWILSIAWSPDGKKLASGCKNSKVIVWDPESGKQVGRTLTGHTQWITWLSWKPLHLDGECRFLASSSKDATVRIWDTVLSRCTLVISGHVQSVTAVKWGGSDLLYTGSKDRTVKVWRASDGTLCRTLHGHGHWVNTLALSTDYSLRTGAFDPAKATLVKQSLEDSADSLQERALALYMNAKGSGTEVLVSGSDDFTMYMWRPEEDKKPLCRMSGHQQPINEVLFSPDGRLIASASFDKSIKLWDGKTGKYLASLRGHVGRVYQVAWASDSRLLCSGSADSTLKVWDVSTRKLLHDLPGHADEVYAVDWSPDGQRVGSGGKDKVLKLWRK